MSEWYILARRRQCFIKQSPIYLQDDDGMLRGVLIQQVLEVGGAGAQDHLVGFGMLALEDFMKLMSKEASLKS